MIAPGQAQELGRAAASAFLRSTSSQLRNQIQQSGAVILQRRSSMPGISVIQGDAIGVEAVIAYEAGREQQRVMGIRLDWSQHGLVGDLRYTYLDLHEIDAVIRGIIYMTSEHAREIHGEAELREGHIATREGFVVGYEAHRDQLTPYIAWSPGGLRRGLGPDGFYEIRERFELARESLFAN